MNSMVAVGRADFPAAACFEMGTRITLRIPRRESRHGVYPTDSLQKGLTLEHDGRSLAEEGVGFGVPMLKHGLQTIFPGGLGVTRLDAAHGRVDVEYNMNLVEHLALRGSSLLKTRVANTLKELTALLHRSYPLARGALTEISNALRSAFGFRTVFEPERSAGIVRMEYRVNPASGGLDMRMDASGIARDGISEVIVMNEQGASSFTEYVDSNGLSLRGGQIATWSPVTAEQATFRDPRQGIRFSARRTPGARLFFGRELVPGRLAWAGFAYVLPPGTTAFHCSVTIGECS
jgi:hypothetical protein